VFPESVCGHLRPRSSRGCRSSRARCGVTWLFADTGRLHRDRARVADIRAQVVSKSAGPAGLGKAPGRDGRSGHPVRSVDRGPADIEDGNGVGESPRWAAVRPLPLRGELRLPRVRVTCAIGPADVDLGETLDGPHEGPLASVTPPYAAVIGGTVRVEPVGRGDPPQDDLIDRARGIVQREPTVHSVENGRTTGNLRKRGLDQVNPHCPMALRCATGWVRRAVVIIQ
jgi:hypothetical protein